MAAPYSVDLRKQILKDYDNGVPIEDLTLHYEVSRSWLYSLLKQRRETGNIAPKKISEAGKVNWHPMNKKFVRSLPTIPTQR